MRKTEIQCEFVASLCGPLLLCRVVFQLCFRFLANEAENKFDPTGCRHCARPSSEKEMRTPRAPDIYIVGY